ncbi:hypothetical protein ADK44_11645, partial [Streptomyces rimosus subsp. rimosus]
LTGGAPPKGEVGRQVGGVLVGPLGEWGVGGGGADTGAGGVAVGGDSHRTEDGGAVGEPAPRRHLALLPALRVRASCGAGAGGA